MADRGAVKPGDSITFRCKLKYNLEEVAKQKDASTYSHVRLELSHKSAGWSPDPNKVTVRPDKIAVVEDNQEVAFDLTFAPDLFVGAPEDTRDGTLDCTIVYFDGATGGVRMDAGGQQGDPHRRPVGSVAAAAPDISKIVIDTITFLNDHNCVNTYDADYKDNIALHERPEWRRDWPALGQHPVSHTMATRVALRIEAHVEPQGASAPVVLRGAIGIPRLGASGASYDMSFETPPQKAATDGKLVFERAASEQDLPRAIADIDFAVNWTAEAQGKGGKTTPAVEPRSTVNQMFITVGLPTMPPPRKDNDKHPAPRGFTRFRLRTATEAAHADAIVQLCAKSSRRTAVPPVNPLDPHDIALGVMLSIGYDPNADRKNEWEMGQSAQGVGDCYSIVRFTESVMDILGVPGSKSLVVVWAQPSAPVVAVSNVAPYPSIVKNEKGEDRLFHPPPETPANPKRRTWKAMLIDMGSKCNAFEACLRLQHSGKIRLYAGGMDVFTDADVVLRQFAAMSWVEGFIEQDMIHEYRSRTNP